MSVTTLIVSPGDDLYRIAAEYYGDATAWNLIAYANDLSDPLIQTGATLNIPAYSAVRGNDGLFAPPMPP